MKVRDKLLEIAGGGGGGVKRFGAWIFFKPTCLQDFFFSEAQALTEFFFPPISSLVTKIYIIIQCLRESGRDPFNQNFRKFRSKIQWIGSLPPVSKKLVHLLRWTTFPGRTGRNFGWMDRAHNHLVQLFAVCLLQYWSTNREFQFSLFLGIVLCYLSPPYLILLITLNARHVTSSTRIFLRITARSLRGSSRVPTWQERVTKPLRTSSLKAT